MPSEMKAFCEIFQASEFKLATLLLEALNTNSRRLLFNFQEVNFYTQARQYILEFQAVFVT